MNFLALTFHFRERTEILFRLSPPPPYKLYHVKSPKKYSAKHLMASAFSETKKIELALKCQFYAGSALSFFPFRFDELLLIKLFDADALYHVFLIDKEYYLLILAVIRVIGTAFKLCLNAFTFELD